MCRFADTLNTGGSMVSHYTPVTALSYAVMPQVSTGGRAYMPVESRYMVYSHFKYVSGVPSGNGQAGVSIGKLEILNTLIGQLLRMKKDAANDITIPTNTNSGTMDSMIEHVNKKIHTEIAIAKNTVYGPLPPQPAALLSLTT